MAEPITMQPRLYEGVPSPNDNEDAIARINRLIGLQNSIGRNPGAFKQAFTELGDSATDEVLDIHDDTTATRDASRSPKKRILEYFAKRDDLELKPDEASDDAVFSDTEVRDAIKDATSKRAILRKTGIMGSSLDANPEAQEASNVTRRLIFGKMLDRFVEWEKQKPAKREKQAG